MERQKDAKRDDSPNTYEELFIRFSTAVEKWLIRTLIGLLIAFVVAQLLLQIAPVRKAITPVDSLEGNPYSETGGES